MDIKRTVLWVIFFMSVVMLFDNWQRDHGRPSMFFPSATQPTKTASNPHRARPHAGAQPSELPQRARRHGRARHGDAARHGARAARQVHDGRVLR